MKKILIITYLLSTSVFAKTLYKSRVSNLVVTKNDTEIIYKIEGTINYPLAQEIESEIHYIDQYKDLNIVFELNSGGGDVEEGHKIIGQIRKLTSEGHHVSTRVQNGRMCGSMCVPIFLAANNREAGEVSSFMFHGVTTGWATIPNDTKTKALFKYMKQRGLKPSFEKYLYSKGALTTPGEFWISSKELTSRDSGIITRLLDAHIKKKAKSYPYTPKL